MSAPVPLRLPLVGPAGEPVDLWRTLTSHGVASLPPHRLDEETRRLSVAVRLAPGRVRVVEIADGGPGHAAIVVAGPPPDPAEADGIEAAIRRLLRLDEDLSPFYAAVAGDPDLAWAATGAGRMLRSATVFEDVVKTICTTNCAWSATERMVGALVAHLGEPAPADHDPPRRAFPTPEAMAAAPEEFYRDVVRAGYRGRYLRALAASVAAGELDLEALAAERAATTDEVAARLLALPGVGPYAAAHILTLIGRYDRLIFDSWTRPTYRRLAGLDACEDREIAARFARYGPYAGLAFWLYLTRRWVAEEADAAGA